MERSVLDLQRPLPRLDQTLYLSRAPYAESRPLRATSVTFTALAKWDRLLSSTPAGTTRFGLVTFASMVPDAQHYVRLRPDRQDQFGMPCLELRIRFGTDVEQTIAESYSRLRTILDDTGLPARVTRQSERVIPGYSTHYAGTARMHASPEYGVLNGWNQVHDARNVVVADASSFTTAVEKNPTLTAMALAARAADRLADDLTGRHPQQMSEPQMSEPVDAPSNVR
jgi:choline dehydrogenase-like flavoprotein